MIGLLDIQFPEWVAWALGIAIWIGLVVLLAKTEKSDDYRPPD